MKDACERLECPYRDKHPRLDEQIRQLEDRADKNDVTLEKLRDLASSVSGRLEHIDGKIEGALASSKFSGSIIGSLITAGVAGAISLIIALTRKG